MDYSPPGSSVHGISQARMLEWVPLPSPGDLPDSGIEPASPAWQADSLPAEQPGKLSIYHIWEQTSVLCWCGKGDRYLPAQIYLQLFIYLGTNFSFLLVWERGQVFTYTDLMRVSGIQILNFQYLLSPVPETLDGFGVKMGF